MTRRLPYDIIEYYRMYGKEVIHVPKNLNDLPDASRFWNLEDLIPRRRQESAAVRQEPRDTRAKSEPKTVSVKDEAVGDAPIADQPLTRAVFPLSEKREVPECVFSPEGLLLREVRVYPWKSDYVYYEKFREHARILFKKEGREVPIEPFFSYMPQYSQMNRAQLATYLWWRTNFRRGTLLDVDYSYLLLYLYELINVGDLDDHARAQGDMLRLWLSYRDRYRHLDVLVREWLIDYSLLYRLPPPKLPPALFRELVSGCRLKEFYIGGASAATTEEAILFFASNYDYQRSKFYREDTKALFDTVLHGAVRVALALKEEEHRSASERRDSFSTITRDTFAGAICTVRQKKHIEVDFSSFSHTHEFRYIVTDALKYCENALRAYFGIKSRLTVYGMTAELKARLDEYLAVAIPKRAPRREVHTVETPAYEMRYDLPKTEISPERAAEIERVSWETTKRLVEAFGEDADMLQSAENEKIPTNGVGKTPQNLQFAEGMCETVAAEQSAPEAIAVGEKTNDTEKSAFAAALGDLAELLLLADRGDIAAQRAFARRTGQMLDAMADRVNALAADFLGDILLEECDGGYVLIEDYREQMIAEGILT